MPSSCGEGRRRELAAILEIIAYLKSLASQVLMEQGWLAPLLQQAVRAQAQGTSAALEEALKKASLPDRVGFISPSFLSHDASHHFGAPHDLLLIYTYSSVNMPCVLSRVHSLFAAICVYHARLE